MSSVAVFMKVNVLHRAVAEKRMGCQDVAAVGALLYVTFGGCCARGGRRDNGVGAVHCILSVVDVYWSQCPFVLIVEKESYNVISVFVR